MEAFKPIIHKYEATVGEFYVNSFLVELEKSVVAIDATLANSSVEELRNLLQNVIKKELVAVLLTHGHPDHYTGVGHLIRGYGDIPILATQGAIEQARARDEEESGFLGSDQAFGPDYPSERVFPNKIVSDRETYIFDNVAFTIEHLGACESDDDSLWSMKIGDEDHIFIGDIVYNHMHTFFRDGHVVNWLKKLDDCIEKFDHTTIFHTGHGEDMGIETFYWQKGYINAFLALLESMLGNKETLNDEEKYELFDKMKLYLPNDKLLMLTMWQFDDMVKALRKDGAIYNPGSSA